MPTSNEEATRRWLEALSREDFDEALALLHSDVELVPPGGQRPHRGLEAVRRWMQPEAFPKQDINVLEAVATGEDTVLARHHITAHGARSGIELDITSWSVWRFDADGLITRIEIYQEHEEDRAREAAARRRPV
jgi:ketosteroid isomerase-like protein